MRKLILLNLILCFLFGFSVTKQQVLTVNAESEYRRIINEDTPLYLDGEGCQFLFFLPYTYYVKILNTYGNFFHVECYGTGDTIALDGYVPKNMLYQDGLEVTSPYPEKKITTSNATILYQDTELTINLQYVL